MVFWEVDAMIYSFCNNLRQRVLYTLTKCFNHIELDRFQSTAQLTSVFVGNVNFSKRDKRE